MNGAAVRKGPPTAPAISFSDLAFSGHPLALWPDLAFSGDRCGLFAPPCIVARSFLFWGGRPPGPTLEAGDNVAGSCLLPGGRMQRRASVSGDFKSIFSGNACCDPAAYPAVLPPDLLSFEAAACDDPLTRPATLRPDHICPWAAVCGGSPSYL